MTLFPRDNHTPIRLAAAGGLALLLAACSPEMPTESVTEAPPAAPGAANALVQPTREGNIALGESQASAWDLYQSLRAAAGGDGMLQLDNMPDWSGLWTREGPPLFDSAQSMDDLTTAPLRPAALAELQARRARSAEGIEYDPISDCSPPGFPRWLAIPFLREFVVTPSQTWLTSETVNNVRRIYTDGRAHTPLEDAYPLWYGDSIGFWSDQRLVIHTSQIRENIFHRNDPRHSDQIEVVEVWEKVNADTIYVDTWSYDPVTLETPWYTRHTYRKLSNPDNAIRIGYWHCNENDNNVVVETEEGSSQFGAFTFDSE